MDATKHTPGPWTVEQNRDYVIVTCGRPIDADEVKFRLYGGEEADSDAVSIANARLICAAPDLLKELAHLVRLIEPLERDGGLNIPGLATLNGARAAVAKAEGK